MRSTEEGSTSSSPRASSNPSRHARVWLARDTWREHLRSPHDASTLAVLDRWFTRNQPAVARRRDANTDDDDCALAIALPLSQGRSRMAFVVASRAVVRVAQPLRLDELIASAPAGWQAALQDLVVRGERVGTSFHVYGSLAWQHITGKACVTPASDVDLLWAARDGSHVERTLELLVEWERESNVRADGEVLLRDGGACAWRELLGRPARVLVKTDDGVAMRPSPLDAAKDVA